MAVRASLALLMLLASGADRTSAQGLSGLEIEPYQVHPGHQVFFSGSGFKPHARLSFSAHCRGSRGSLRGAAVTTDVQGRFLDRAFTVSGQVHNPSPCTIVAIYKGGAPATLIGAALTLMPPGRPLAHCATHICASISLEPSGSGVEAQIMGWPGASMHAVFHGGGKTITYHSALNWIGLAFIELPTGARTRRGSLAVRLSLAGYSGTKTYSWK